MDIAQIVELIGNIGIIVASGAAIWGVSAWRREFKGKRDMELAEDVLCLFYRAERAIQAVRCPGSYLSEQQGRAPEQRETPEQEQARNQAHVVFKRIQDHAQVFDQLYALRFRFVARFGRGAAKPFDEMKGIIDDIWVAAGCLAVLWAERLRRGENTSQGTEEQITNNESVIWSKGADDQIAPRVTNIIEEIEGVCRPIIEGQASWFSRFWRKPFAGKAVARS
jgi:hypothetical protein